MDDAISIVLMVIWINVSAQKEEPGWNGMKNSMNELKEKKEKKVHFFQLSSVACMVHV